MVSSFQIWTTDMSSPPPSGPAHRRSSRSTSMTSRPNAWSRTTQAKHPDDFVIDTLDLSPGSVARVIAEQAGALRNPPRSISELLDTLRDQRLVRSVAKLRELFSVGDL